MSNITFSVGEYTSEDKTVLVTYTNEVGHTHERRIVLPKTSEGEIDAERLTSRLDNQLQGLYNKFEVGAVTFIDPNANPEEPPV